MEDIARIVKESIAMARDLLLELSDIGNELYELHNALEEVEQASTNSNLAIAEEVSKDVLTSLEHARLFLSEVVAQKEAAKKVFNLRSRNEEMKKITNKINSYLDFRFV